MATTRLGQIAVGVEPYGIFLPKEAAAVVVALSEPHFATTAAFMRRLSENWTATDVIGLNGVTEPNGDFVVLEHEVVKAFKPSVTSRRFFQDGQVKLCLYIQVGTGLTNGLTTAGQLASLFREREFDGVRTYTPHGPLIGDYNDEGNYLELSIVVPYRYQYDG